MYPSSPRSTKYNKARKRVTTSSREIPLRGPNRLQAYMLNQFGRSGKLRCTSILDETVQATRPRCLKETSRSGRACSKSASQFYEVVEP